MQKIRKGVIVSLLAIMALTSNTSMINAQPFEMKKEIKYSIQHSDITEAGIKKEDLDEIVNKLPNLESENKIETLIEQEEKAKLSNEDIAKMVINGEYGNGEEIEQRLEEEGRNIDEIQKEVEKAKLSNEDIAKMVINGEYGNGEERKQRLEEEGRNIDEIQKEVEKILNIQKEQEEKREKQAKTNKSSDKGSVKSRTQTQSKPASQPKPAVTNQNSGKTMTMKATAYSTAQPGLGRYTANGTDLHTNPRVIAVDPRIIPLGTKVSVEGYGTYIAADTGGAIKGNRIDIHFSTVQECINFGRKSVKITIHN